ncbi:DNA-directed RNA polymerase V subunit 5A-like [Helianthus annuus]|uniref:DNA-directed RNA polymerase V subunit 5A-like n=1 Tax=Helianthus annuus TaxID=4232 RepID=UPI000B8F2F9C|nr:DNA-directed RNA polymerase V subunit 5A-like [Helianthus annuus]
MDENGGDAMETDTNNNNGTVGKCLSSFVDDGTVESHRNYLSRRTLLEMLRDRDRVYDVFISEIDLTLRQFRDLHGKDIDVDRIRISASHVSDPENKWILVETVALTRLSQSKLFPLRFDADVNDMR